MTDNKPKKQLGNQDERMLTELVCALISNEKIYPLTNDAGLIMIATRLMGMIKDAAAK